MKTTATPGTYSNNGAKPSCLFSSSVSLCWWGRNYRGLTKLDSRLGNLQIENQRVVHIFPNAEGNRNSLHVAVLREMNLRRDIQACVGIWVRIERQNLWVA